VQGLRQLGHLPAARESPEPRSELPDSGLRILLVEDEKMVRELSKRILVGAGFHVSEAADAEEAFVRARKVCSTCS
jgi:PleD family two-component response regulator